MVSNADDIEKNAEYIASKQLMIEEILVQHPDRMFGNTSINTIRVHTILDGNGKGHVLSCVLRAGVGDTVVDNYCSGGVIYPVDVDSGIVTGKGVSRSGGCHITHLQTEIVMLGYRMPNWKILIEKTSEATERLSHIRWIGWDVAITRDGIAVIEGNHSPDYDLYEFIGEGKSDPTRKSFI